MFGFGKRNIETRDAPVTESVGSPTDWLLELFGAQPATAGFLVSPKNAMNCTPVRCAVQTIAESIGQLPLHLYRRMDSGGKERERDNPLANVLNVAANDWTPAADFREQITRDALLWGNGYAFINRVNGEVRELVRMAPDTITVEINTATGEPIYKVATGQEVGRILDRRDVLHIRAPGSNGMIGDSPVRQGREAIATALAMEAHCSGLFGNGARPSGVIEFPNKLPDEAVKRMKAAWNSAMSGSANSGKTALLWDGGKFNPLTFSSVDAQFLELRKFAIEEIARIFRVPPVFLMEYGRATWGNSEEMGRQFVTFTLTRWIKQWQGEILLKLIEEGERDKLFAEFLVDDLLRADLAARATAYSQLITSRILSPNEVRAMENRPPYEGGDQYLNPNTTTGGNANGNA